MSSKATLILTRHGQTVWHRENRYAGITDIDLTDVGRAQAADLAVWAGFQKLDGFYSSPVRRARETAAPVAQLIGREPIIIQDLREVDFGIAEGRTMGELKSANPEMVAAFKKDAALHPFPGSEPPIAAAARGAAALRDIAAKNQGKTVLVVAHNTFIRLSLCELLGIPIGTYRNSLPKLDNGTLTRISLTGQPDAPTALLSFNVPLAAELALLKQ